MLIFNALKPFPPSDKSRLISRRSVIAKWVLIATLLGYFLYTIVWLGIWDGTDDGIRVLIMLVLSALTATAAGVVIGMSAAGWRRWTGLVSAALVIGLVRWAITVPDNNFNPYKVTEDAPHASRKR